MYQAFVDESGTTTPFRKDEGFLAVVAVIGERRAQRKVENLLKRIRKRARKAAGTEFKSTSATPEERRCLLQGLADVELEIVAVIVDKRMVYLEPKDPEDWYRQAVALVARHCLTRWPRAALILDKRYTSESLRDRLENAIRASLDVQSSSHIPITQMDSQGCLGLQVADFAAWAIGRKYERGDATYYELILSKIVVEDVIEPSA